MYCPLCNGIAAYSESCSSCGGNVSDCGRLSDWTGPYAPYEQITADSYHSAAPFVNLEAACSHMIYCSSCQQLKEIVVSQWH